MGWKEGADLAARHLLPVVVGRIDATSARGPPRREGVSDLRAAARAQVDPRHLDARGDLNGRGERPADVGNRGRGLLLLVDRGIFPIRPRARQRQRRHQENVREGMHREQGPSGYVDVLGTCALVEKAVAGGLYIPSR